MNRWHYGIGGVRRGPVGDADLRTLAATGQLQPTDLVWRPGMSEWVPARKVKGLFPADQPPPLPVDRPPQLPDRVVSRPRRAPSTVRNHRWQAWEMWVDMIATFGFFIFYLVPSWAGPVGRITGTRRMPFGALLTLGIFTLSIALVVTPIVYAFALARHGERSGELGSNPRLGQWVLALTLAEVVLVFVPVLGFVLVWLVTGPLIIWLIQSEVNRYATASPGRRD